MAHYAWVDKDNKVVNTSVVKDENNMKDGVEDEATGQAYLMEIHKDRDFVKNGGRFLKYSLNTWHNKHWVKGVDENGNSYAKLSDDQSKAFRGNGAEKGGYYDPENDVFLPVQPFPSWTFNYEKGEWYAPVEPTEEQKSRDVFDVYWDEEAQEWKEPPEDQVSVKEHLQE
tara:strand:- start:1791 stop:2300 length:510 start_codon:yes stop_codon:yes gene_type:complete